MTSPYAEPRRRVVRRRLSFARAILCLLAVLAWIAPPMPVSAQVTGAILQGIVTDPSNAPVPGVEITLKNTETGVTTTTRTNAAGLYEFPEMRSGPYELTAKASGFGLYTHRDIRLVFQQRLRVDFSLQLATVIEKVEVTGTPTLLEADSAKASHLVSGNTVANLPINGRNVFMVTRLMPGGNTSAAGERRQAQSWTLAPSNISINGAPVQGNAVLMDGVSNQFGTGAMSYGPTTDSVQEVQIQTFALSAEYGQSAGSVISMTSKSGTNKLHGSVYENHNSTRLNARDFFGNKLNSPKTENRYNTYGATLGGPVYIPGAYDGRNQMFFFFAYEADRELFGYRAVSTVPVTAIRGGDFSDYRLADGRLVQIFDPFTTRFNPDNPSQLIRDPLAGNRIPPSRLSPVGLNVMKFYPQPNAPGIANNYSLAGGYTENANAVQIKIDRQIRGKHNLFGFFGQIRNNEWYQGSLPTGPSGWLYYQDFKLWTLGYTHVASPTMIVNLRAGLTWARPSQDPLTTRADREGLGFSKRYLDLIPAPAADFPSFGLQDFAGLGGSTFRRSYYPPNIRTSVTKIAGRHSLTVGHELLLNRTNIRTTGGEAGSFSFNRDWTQGPIASQASATAGNGVATLLLGPVSSGSITYSPSNNAAQTVYNGLFIQDNWRVTPTLTLNLGFRWDYQTPVTERYDRMNRGFDPAATVSIARLAEANYARDPIPEKQSISVKGGLRFVGVGGQSRYNFDPVKANFMPRVGFAWGGISKMVVRGGYGLFFVPLRDTRGFGHGQSPLPMSQLGFTSSTAMQTAENGRPQHTIVDPFPQGLVRPVGSSLGPDTLLGQSLSVADVTSKRAYNHQFQVSVQRQLPWQSVLDVAYVGSRVRNLQVNENINAMPNEYLSLRDDAARRVTNPFLGLIAIGNLSQTTVAKSQLLLPYPQFGGISHQFRPIGSSWYNSLQASVNKRMQGGLNFLLGYTWAKDMSRRSFLNNYQDLERVISQVDRTHRLTLSGLWELPVGKGRKFGGQMPAALNYAIGGWELLWITIFDSGQPVSGWSGSIVTGTPRQIDRTIDKWFDTSAFGVQPQFTLRTVSSLLSGIRADGVHNFDLTIGKTFPIKEPLKLRFTTQFFNAFNSPQFSSPNTSVTSPAFGTISGQANYPRWIQLAAKVEF